MLARLKAFIEEKELFTQSEKLLIAVSGGVDSMVLLDLMRQLEYNIYVAHCNFNLRARESDQDEELVRAYCREHEIPCFVTSFSTKEIAAERKISIQMAARELRYEWFAELQQAHSLDRLITAHHLNDHVETFFIHLIRGSGLRGLSGMPYKTEQIARPLIFTTKQEVREYAEKKKVVYREDVSNQDDKYLRNKIRLDIIPQLEELNPSFIQNAQKSMHLIEESLSLLEAEVKRFSLTGVEVKGDDYKIDWKKLQASISPRLLAFELLKPFGFNPTQIEFIVLPQELTTGSILESETHTLLVNRQELVIALKSDRAVARETIQTLVFENRWLKGELISREELTAFPDGKTVAAFDADKIGLPVILNGWKKGDAFQPFGMKTFKKLSDFFIDEKLSLFQKEKVQLLRSGDAIVWVVGHRADNRFRIDENTTQVWKVTVK
jgi:tRNA(Ile)-lysidine synthase